MCSPVGIALSQGGSRARCRPKELRPCRRRFGRSVSARPIPIGTFGVTTPYHGWLKHLLIALAGKWDGHHQPWEDGSHIKVWSRASLTAFLGAHGLNVIEFIGVGRARWLRKSMMLVARKSEPTVQR